MSAARASASAPSSTQAVAGGGRLPLGVRRPAQGDEHARELEPREGGFVGRAAFAEAVDSVLEQRAGAFVLALGSGQQRLRHVGAGAHRRSAHDPLEGAQLDERGGRLIEPVAGDRGVHEQLERWDAGKGGRVGQLAEHARAALRRQRGLAAAEREPGAAELLAHGGSGALEQFLGLGREPLAALQLGERGDRGAGLPGTRYGEVLDGSLEDRLGLRPAAAPHLNVAVVGAAEADEVAAPALFGDARGAVAPLEGALVVARRGARHDREAERPGTGGGVRRLPLQGQQGGLVEAAHSLLDLRLEYEHGAPQGEPEHLEIRNAELGADGRRPAAQLDRERQVALVPREIPLVEVEPAVLGAGLEWIKEPVRPLHPAARHAHRRVEVDLVAREPGGHPRRAGRVAALPVQVVGPLARGEDRLPVVEPPRRPAQPLQRIGRLLDRERALERRAGVCPAQIAQGLPAVGQQI